MAKTWKLQADIWKDELNAQTFQPGLRISPGLGLWRKCICALCGHRCVSEHHTTCKQLHGKTRAQRINYQEQSGSGWQQEQRKH